MTVFPTFKKKLFFNKGINSGGKDGCFCKGRYNEKWDRILATVTAVLTFILLLSYVFINTLNEKTTENADEDESIVVRNNSSRDLENLKCEITQDCGVACKGFAADDNITAHINEVTKNVSCSALNPLTIIRSVFTNNSISEGWLNYSAFPVYYLILATSNINEIGPKAFTGYPFNGLKILEMEDLPLHPIQSAAFNGANIETLSITYSDEHSLLIEQRAFEGIRSTLISLNIKRCLSNADSLLNITGTYGSFMEKLVRLDLRYNYLTNIPNSAFLGASKLTQLYLGGNSIYKIEGKAFETSAVSSPIKILDLSNNNLDALDETVFSYFADDIKIDLTSNPWNCNCSLQWLKSWYQNNSHLNISDSLLCANSNHSKFNEVDFGCQDSSNSTKATDSPSTTHSDNDYEYIQLQCINSATTIFPEDYEEWTSLTICVRTNLMELEIYELDVESVSFEVKVTGRIENSHVMWYNTKNKSDYGCVSIVDDKFLMQNLERTATYTICALYDGETTTSPYDCVGFVVPVDWGSQTWLPNNMIKPIIGSLCSVLLLEAIVVGVVVFYCIRQHPKFISGNKRVVVVSTKTTDAIIMPKSYSQSVRKETPVAASTPGYLTPKCPRKNDQRKRMLRSMSESSVLSGSYISKEEIYRRRRKETTLYEMSDEEHIYESPVLPPKHHSEVRKHSCK